MWSGQIIVIQKAELIQAGAELIGSNNIRDDEIINLMLDIVKIFSKKENIS